ncbi:Major facilitator superfamily multidrug-resistance DHA1 sub-family [Mycena kentingensis (nom. inval.)]|nr:Major facilitator superfamily multidrug-resistance DHA1 sub-family [Mycena kentingensis (nom. inval.)]
MTLRSATLRSATLRSATLRSATLRSATLSPADGEFQPLLSARHERYDDSTLPLKRTPLPKAQLGIILFLHLSEPLTSQLINPFAPQLIRDIGVTNGDETKVGYYVGIMQSLFFFAQALTVLHWARLSDRIGRKPVLLCGLIGLIFAMYGFGLSLTFWGLVACRSLHGALNGNVSVMKSMLAELTDATNIAAAYGYLPIAWSTGSILGPMIGGLLAHPAETFPAWFGNSAFLKKYPYFLPCAIPATYAIVAWFVTLFFLRETASGPAVIKIPSIVERREGAAAKRDSEDAPLLEPVPEVPESEQAFPINQLFTKRILLAGGNYAILSLVDISLRAIHPVFLATPIELGGLGMPTVQIGKVMALFGAFNGIFQIFFFAPMVDWLGSKTMYNFGLACLLPTYAMFPLLSVLAQQQGESTDLIWYLSLVQVFSSIGTGLSHGAIFIYISSAAPNRASLGGTYGLCQLVVSLVRTFGPAAATALFSLSIEQWFDANGWMVYYVMIVVNGVALYFGSLLPQKPWVMGEADAE